MVLAAFEQVQNLESGKGDFQAGFMKIFGIVHFGIYEYFDYLFGLEFEFPLKHHTIKTVFRQQSVIGCEDYAIAAALAKVNPAETGYFKY